jgi:ComF family protein
MSSDMDPPARMAKGLLRGAADFLWPQRSLVSGQRGAGKGPLSAAEFAAVGFLSDPVCDACGRPMEIDLGPYTHCAACIARPPRWDRARAAIIYDAASRRIVLDLKRSGRRDGLSTMTGWMHRAGAPLIAQADLVVPVPLHYTRLVRRGFNQSAWLAQGIARRAGVACHVHLVKRRRRTPTQGGLSARARRRNVAGAFAISKRAAALVRDRRVLLVDDVLTTGATVSACARALKQAGARQVDVLVLARVVRETDLTI